MSLTLPYLIDPTPGRRVWKGEGWELREGLWQDSPPEEVDHVIADPPFGERTHEKRRRGEGYARHNPGSRPDPVAFSPLDADGIVLMAPRLVALSRRWVVLFCESEQLGDYRRACPAEWMRAGAWCKTNPTPQFTGDRPGVWGEGLAILHQRGRKRWNNGGRRALWCGGSEEHGCLRVHETQKPLWLMRALILDFTDPGDLVWDPFCGSGTTGVACLQLGRRFLGHEMQPRYAEVAAERLSAAENGQTLTQARAGQGILFAKGKP